VGASPGVHRIPGVPGRARVVEDRFRKQMKMFNMLIYVLGHKVPHLHMASIYIYILHRYIFHIQSSLKLCIPVVSLTLLSDITEFCWFSL